MIFWSWATSQTSYEYQPLPSTRHVRLVHIQPGERSAALNCHISVHLLDDPPQYSALSYTWGSPVQERFIDCDDLRLGVTLNLWKALRSLRQATDTRTFWIDAICINQKNIHERNSQVRLMKEIYQRAVEVVVWLGEDKQNSADGVSLIPRIHAAALNGKLLQDPDSLSMRLDQTELPGFDSIVSQPHLVWVSQRSNHITCKRITTSSRLKENLSWYLYL